MSEIRFRVWDKWKKRFYLGDEDQDDLNFGYNNKRKHWTLRNEINFKDIGKKGKERFIILQFTGLTDIYGNEIYEGDILKLKYLAIFKPKIKISKNLIGGKFEFGLVQWSDENKKLTTRYAKSYSADFVENKSEVIGNIYENPKLFVLSEESA